MRLFKAVIYINTHHGLGINQEQIVFIVSESQVEASKALDKEFPDGEVNSLELCDGSVIVVESNNGNDRAKV